MITSLKDVYLISADKDKNSKTASGLFIDTSWDKYGHAVQEGIVESCPLALSNKYSNDVRIEKGDIVHFHHFVAQDDNSIIDNGKELFKCNRHHMYCVLNHKQQPIMLDDWLFASPILEREEDIVKTFGTLKLWTKVMPDKIHLMAKAEFVSNECLKAGIEPGDTIIHKKDADYEMKVNDVTYYRMKLANVVAVIRNNMLSPLGSDVIVESTIQNERITASGLIIPIFKQQREQIETIVAIGYNDEEKQFKVGDKVMLLWHTGTNIEFNGKNYIVLRQDNILGKLLNNGKKVKLKGN